MMIVAMTEVILESSAVLIDAAKSGASSVNTTLANLGARNTMNAALVIQY